MTEPLWRDELRDPRDLLAHPRNPRTHSAEQIDQVRAAIREWGFTNPPLITADGRIIAGHCRTIAAEAEGLQAIPVRVRDQAHPLTEAQELALIVADNKLAENAGWDDAALASILSDLRHAEYHLDLTGFSAGAIEDLFAGLPHEHRGGPTPSNPAHYKALQDAAGGQWFARPYRELRTMYDQKMGGDTSDRLSAKHEFFALRAYFDNTHDNMTDVWQFGRVVGDERYGHATPKPVAMLARCIVSSSKPGDVVLEPFAGTGSTLIAAETCGRACYTMDLSPLYVDVTVRRWQALTGGVAVRERDGVVFDELDRVQVKAAA